MPTVSVIIPTHNRAGLLEQAVRSVLGQTYHDLELIVVDDGSTDDTRARVASFARDARVRYEYQERSGPSRARNIGIRASAGSYIAFLDDDDVWLPEKLTKQMAILSAQHDVDVAYCGFTWIDAEGNVMPLVYRRPERRGTLYEDLMYGNVIAGSGSSVLLRSKCFVGVGLFDESLRVYEDQDMWRRLALAGCEFVFVDETLLHIRRHDFGSQRDRARVAADSLLYLDKLRAEAPREFRHHLPEIAYGILSESAVALFLLGRGGEMMDLVAKIVALGPRYVLRFIVRLVPARLQSGVGMLSRAFKRWRGVPASSGLQRAD